MGAGSILGRVGEGIRRAWDARTGRTSRGAAGCGQRRGRNFGDRRRSSYRRAARDLAALLGSGRSPESLRQGLVAVLEDEPDFEVAGTAGSAYEQAIELTDRVRPDVILLDLELPGMGDMENIGHLLHQSPEAGILVFTAYAGDERVIGAVRAGARGYLLKGAAAGEIARAVRTVRAGETFLQPAVASTLVARLSTPRRSAGLLTEREHTVLRLVAQGLPDRADRPIAPDHRAHR